MITISAHWFCFFMFASFVAGELAFLVLLFTLQPRRHTEEQVNTLGNTTKDRIAAEDTLCTVQPLTLDEQHRIQSGYFKGAILQTRGDQ